MPLDRPAMPARAMLRAEQRFATRLPALMDCAATAFSVQLLDLSQGGALAEAPAPPGAGSTVAVRVDRFTIEAVVVWSERRRFGLRFVQPLRATELLLLLSRSREATTAVGRSVAACELA